MTKYHNVKTRGYDSRKEARRAQELRLLTAAGKITDLREQVRYELIPAQYETKDGKRKLLERKCEYVADFVYTDNETGETVVEDVKGYATEAYKIKRKLMLLRGIKIREV